jgi:hypothetical protein
MRGTRRWVRLGLGLTAVALLAVSLVLTLGGREDGGSGEAQPLEEPVEAEGRLVRPVHLFGDAITARLDILVDRERVDSETVGVETAFAPYAFVEPPRITRREAGAVTLLRYTAKLRCLTASCAPQGRSARFFFEPAVVTYGLSGGENAGARSLEVGWPVAEVRSRLSRAEREGVVPPDTPIWSADASSPPAVSYRVRPGLAAVLLIAAAAVLLAAVALVALRAVRRRRRGKPPLTALERALLVLEGPESGRGSAAERKALELVAAELRGRGEATLAGEARELAWSETAPSAEAEQALAGRVRDLIEERVNGRVA